ncbi:MAG TPA: M42 family metallopeptidase [Chloroflexi bacterium]|nr:M42 family metallopeptidase [Chloroflexota bacterium]
MLLKDLSEARGVSGDEGAVREVLIKAVEGLVDEHRVDALGNLICLRRARRPVAEGRWPRTVMVTAHMDEVGLMITGINNDGTLRFGKVGGIDDRVLLSKQVLVGKNAVPGVIGYAPIHLIPPADRSKAPDASKAAIDIGAKDKAGAERLVSLGDYATFATSFEVLDEGGLRTAKGKAFDDRVGCAALVELLREDYAFDVYAVFTAQEEVGLRGARVAAYAAQPDVAFALEGTICDDLPRKKDVSPVTELGKGPALTFMDQSVIADRRLVRLLVDTAERLGIPYQFKRAAAGGTDAGAIHLTREGVPSAVVAVPARYIHAPVSMVSLDDLDHTVQLMKAALHAMEGGLNA